MIRKIIEELKVPYDEEEEDVEFNQVFMSHDVDKLRDFANISYQPPRKLSLPTPSAQKKKGVKEEATISQAQKTLLCSGVELEILKQMEKLNANLEGLHGMFHERLSALILFLDSSLTVVVKLDDAAQK